MLIFHILFGQSPIRHPPVILLSENHSVVSANENAKSGLSSSQPWPKDYKNKKTHEAEKNPTRFSSDGHPPARPAIIHRPQKHKLDPSSKLPVLFGTWHSISSFHGNS
ncbi:hypothetical protein VTJ04DRAFT_1504 [Mycothermus thermophilus]|uniref:uncharacterized protein n=1 Tax=Humicola insolens TaxID=85995 RepID=UPI003742C11D